VIHNPRDREARKSDHHLFHSGRCLVLLAFLSKSNFDHDCHQMRYMSFITRGIWSHGRQDIDHESRVPIEPSWNGIAEVLECEIIDTNEHNNRIKDPLELLLCVNYKSQSCNTSTKTLRMNFLKIWKSFFELSSGIKLDTPRNIADVVDPASGRTESESCRKLCLSHNQDVTRAQDIPIE
jgi:hypothetical protein